MKNKLFFSTLFTVALTYSFSQPQNEVEGVSIANDETPPSRDAVLDVVSSKKGVLIPRMTKSVIETGGYLDPQTIKDIGQDGLMIFITDQDANYGYWYFDDQLNEWIQLSAVGINGGLWSKRTDNDNIYNTGFSSNKVGVGLDDPTAKFHVSSQGLDDIALFESNRQAFGIHDSYSGIGPGSLIIHKSKFQSNSAWVQMDHNNIRRLVLNTFHTSPTDAWGTLTFRNGWTLIQNAGNGSNQGDMLIQACGDLRLEAVGTVYMQDGVACTSDSLLKTNFNQLTGSLSNLQNITGYSYKWVDPERDQEKQYGLLAQNIQRYYPELVHRVNSRKIDSNGDPVDNYHLVLNYNGLIAVIIEGIKEQQTLIDSQKTRISDLEAQVANLNSKLSDLEARVSALEGK